MLLEARLVAGSKLTSDISHPPASYKEGVSFPGGTQQKERDAVSPWKSQAQSGVVCGSNFIKLHVYMWRIRWI